MSFSYRVGFSEAVDVIKSKLNLVNDESYEVCALVVVANSPADAYYKVLEYPTLKDKSDVASIVTSIDRLDSRCEPLFEVQSYK